MQQIKYKVKIICFQKATNVTELRKQYKALYVVYVFSE